MPLVAADWVVDRETGNIRYIGDDHGGASPSYATVIEFHRWLQDLADDASSVGTDELDITDEDPSSRSTDNIIDLLGNYNINDKAAEHLYDGSIIQSNGDEIYDGIVNFGVSTVQIQIIQDGAVIKDDFWNQAGGGLNADAVQGISHRFMIKVRRGGNDIDGRRLIGISRQFGQTYAEFSINGTGRGNNVLALTNSSDLNNTTAIDTVAGWTGIQNTSEGYVGIDVDNNAADEFYYSEWDANTPTRSINNFYERLKWLSKDPVVESSGVGTGSDYTVGNGTILDQGQSFTMGDNSLLAHKAVFNIKKVLTPSGTAVAHLHNHTGTFGSTGTPTGAPIATSEPVKVHRLQTSYQPVTFDFSSNVILNTSGNYFVSVAYSGGDASNYIQLQGSAASTHPGNRAEETTGWAASATTDLNFGIYTTPSLYGLPGILFRGITHEIDVDGPTGTFTPPELLTWPIGSGQILAINSTTAATKVWIQLLKGVVPSDNQVLTGADSSATVTAELTGGSITNRNIPIPFVGVSTGSAIIGGYGVGIQTDDLTASDLVFDLTDTQVTPPNNVTFTVGGLVNTEDRVLVGPWDGVSTDAEGNPAIDKDQLTLNTALTGPTETAVVTTVAIPTDTPSTGTIRIQLDSGLYRRVTYSSYTGSTFTIPSTSFSSDNASATNNVWISYIDELASGATASFTGVYDTDRNLVVIVRDGGGTPIKQFITSATFQSANTTVTAIRTSDA